MTKQNIINSLYLGIISGILLGLLLKLVESVTQVQVYTLLLNVDFIPILGRIQWTEPIEFLFHIIISICIAYVFIFLADYLNLKGSIPKLGLLSFILCLPTLGLYFILSVSAIKEVPAWNNWPAFTYWTITHLIYSFVLLLLYLKTIKKEKH